MTIPLFFFMADTDPPEGGTSSAVDVVTLATSMDGGHNTKRSLPPKDRVRADEEFWDVREAYLRMLVGEPTEAPITPAQAEPPPVAPAEAPREPVKLLDTTELAQQQSDLIGKLRSATTVAELKEVGARLMVTQAVLRQEQAKAAAQQRAERDLERQRLEIRIAKRKAATELLKLVGSPYLGRKTEKT